MERVPLPSLTPRARFDDDTIVVGPAEPLMLGVRRRADGGREVVTLVKTTLFALRDEIIALAGQHLGAKEATPATPSAAWPIAAGVKEGEQDGLFDLVEVLRLPLGVSLGELLRAVHMQGRFPVGAALWIGEQLARSYVSFFAQQQLVVGHMRTRLGWDGSVTRPVLTDIDDDAGYERPQRRASLRGFDFERLMGMAPAPESDSYLVARVVLTMLLGDDPFDHPTETSVVAQLQRQHAGQMRRVQRVRDDVPNDLVTFLEACMLRHVDERPGPPLVVAEALRAFRERFDDAGPTLVASMLAAAFPRERAEDVGAEEEAAVVDVDVDVPGLGLRLVEPLAAPPPRPPRGRSPVEVNGVTRGRDGRAMVLVDNLFVDATLVSNGAWLLFIRDTDRAAPAHWGGAVPVPGTEDLPVCNIAPEDAAAFARWSGKRLPTANDWLSYGARAGRVAPRQRQPHGVLDLLRFWEWSADPMPGRPGCVVVRGGRYRDRADAEAEAENVSFDDDAKPDIAFRCVRDVDAPAAPWPSAIDVDNEPTPPGGVLRDDDPHVIDEE